MAAAGQVRPTGSFPAQQRIRKRTEFQRIQGSGRRVFTRHFVVLVMARERSKEHPTARLGITVSRRAGNAAQRNRAKRLIREAFRTTRDLWSPDLDVVVIARSGLGPLRLADVVEEWRSAKPSLERRAQEARHDHKTRNDRLAETR